MRTNTTRLSTVAHAPRLAGGYGPVGATQSPEMQLRRVVMANLLWEKLAYEDGDAIAQAIIDLVPQVSAEAAAAIAMEARRYQKLRHVPLLIARVMAKTATQKHLVGKLLPQIIKRADELTEFLSLYWKDGRTPLSKQVKVGLAAAIQQFDAYQVKKYKQRHRHIMLRDVLFLTHPKPQEGHVAVWRDLCNKVYRQLHADTWEVALSAKADKRETFERLIERRKLGAQAFLRNLSGMEKAGVSHVTITRGFASAKPEWLLPKDFVAAAKAAPQWRHEIEELMFRSFAQTPKLTGTTILIIDVSGSMRTKLSDKSDLQRIDVGATLAMLAHEMCEHVHIYATSGNDATRRHETCRIPPARGFALNDAIISAYRAMGSGGIFTRQCLEWVKDQEHDTPDRIMVFTDSQDCDAPGSGKPQPFGRCNYLMDVSAHTHGVNYQGIWTAEIATWSEYFLHFIAACEAGQQTGNPIKEQVS